MLISRSFNFNRWVTLRCNKPFCRVLASKPQRKGSRTVLPGFGSILLAWFSWLLASKPLVNGSSQGS